MTTLYKNNKPSQFNIFKRAILPTCALLIIAGYVIWFSRFILLFTDPIATLGVASVATGLIFIFFIEKYNNNGSVNLFFFISTALMVTWLVNFITNTGLTGDMRSFANIAGIYSFFPFLVMLQCWGTRNTLRAFYLIGVVYIIFYTFFSFGLLSMDRFSDVPSLSVILQDPDRGRRIYSCTAIIAYVLIYQIANIRRGNGSLLNFCFFGLTLYAIVSAQSRVAMALYAVISVLVVVGHSWIRQLVVRMYFSLFLGYVIIVIFFHELIGHLLELIDDPSLSLRIESLSTAAEFFWTYPLLGLGVPGDASFLGIVTGFLYFPEDLGGVGVVASYGIIGLMWMSLLMLILTKGASTCDSKWGVEFSAASHAATFVILTTAFSHNIFVGDGGLVFGLIFAIYIYENNKEANVNAACVNYFQLRKNPQKHIF